MASFKVKSAKKIFFAGKRKKFIDSGGGDNVFFLIYGRHN